MCSKDIDTLKNNSRLEPIPLVGKRYLIQVLYLSALP